MGVECIGIRFSGADLRVKAFDPHIADMQFSLLPQIISDEEVMQRLANTKRNK
jgi:hypothetical protein